jgi:hypothetical protein
MTAGTHTIPWDRDNYNPGIYTLRYNTGSGDFYSKSVVVK